MNKTIAKLNKLKNPESFIQINTIKGFKYVDKAGEIVNAYHKKNSAPKFLMDLNGLIINEPKDKIYQLKITPQAVWAKFTQIDSLDMVSNLFAKEAETILKILDIKKMNRIGWRNYFIYEFQDKTKRDEYLKKFSVVDNTKLSVLRLEVKTGKDFGANLIIQSVVKNDTDKTFGVLFDVDVFQNGEIDSDNIVTVLRSFCQYLTDGDGFLGVVNHTF